jgi:hypothetical protein
MKEHSRSEWSRYYRLDEANSVSALHARFITHRYPRHAHEHFVISLVESGAQSYSYRGATHITPAGQMFVVNPDEPHAGEAASPQGYVGGGTRKPDACQPIRARPQVPRGEV